MNPYKRVHSPTEYGLLETDQARKKYISEQFAEKMGAMSLNSNPPSTPFSHQYQQQQQQQSGDAPMSIAMPSIDSRKDETKTNLVQTHVYGTMLPFEQRPGESKLRIPEFLLRPSSGCPEARDLVTYSPLSWRPATVSEEAEVCFCMNFLTFFMFDRWIHEEFTGKLSPFNGSRKSR
ncbi:hypothetical protein BDB00DRAFT_836755 [Zychaea mexicana]|uniref:uncharacterized protein n=1 Tax=Zychaea mexicana TaxID=64656 RepID=UPI0022FE288A|nr:uncharacterized protein BDB00DRAFT_836755 [Zychaea mexicana]KAI9490651.1 hypothetical protein BDB00DRAFT_836755 [Zychaea mexicana]